MIDFNKIKTKNIEVISTRRMSPIYVMGDDKQRDFKRFGPKSLLSFECSKDIDFTKHDTARLDDLYLFGLETEEKEIDENNKHVIMFIDGMCFFGNEYKIKNKEE